MTTTTIPTASLDHLDEVSATTSSYTRLQTRKVAVTAVLCVVLAAMGALLFWGGRFTTNMVHDQLASQGIYFPPKGSPALDPAEYPGLQRYAGQLVDNGPKAKAWAEQFMVPHLEQLSGGKPYGQVSLEAFMNPQDQALVAKSSAMGLGEVQRGLLLSAWGWSVVGRITSIVALLVFGLAGVALAAFVYFAVHGSRRPTDC
jgi:hypothetical protein